MQENGNTASCAVEAGVPRTEESHANKLSNKISVQHLGHTVFKRNDILVTDG